MPEQDHHHRLSAPADTDPAANHDLVVVLDYGAHDAQRMARRVREAGVLSEVIGHTAGTEAVLARKPKGIILSGAPEAGDPSGQTQSASARFGTGVPLLQPTHQQADRELRTFLFDVAGCRPDWTPAAIVEESVAAIRAQVGVQGVLCALSGGVDSAVAAALVQRAVGNQLTCVFVDHGLLRQGEPDQVRRDFVAATGVDLTVIDGRNRFQSALSGITDPEHKRKVIGAEFIDCFDRAAAEIGAGRGGVGFLVQGTLYPDVLESGAAGGSNVKSHHNVGGLPQNLGFELVEPLRTLFKDEVRAVGEELGLPAAMVWRQPFPGPGLAVRIIGEVTPQRLETLRMADAIVAEEVAAAGLEHDIWQFPVVLLADVQSVGVQAAGRSQGHPIVLRPVASQDAMTADWVRLPQDLLQRVSTRITDTVPDVNRVVLDVTSKPPGTIEWE